MDANNDKIPLPSLVDPNTQILSQEEIGLTPNANLRRLGFQRNLSRTKHMPSFCKKQDAPPCNATNAMEYLESAVNEGFKNPDGTINEKFIRWVEYTDPGGKAHEMLLKEATVQKVKAVRDAAVEQVEKEAGDLKRKWQDKIDKNTALDLDSNEDDKKAVDAFLNHVTKRHKQMKYDQVRQEIAPMGNLITHNWAREYGFDVNGVPMQFKTADALDYDTDDEA